MVISNFFIANKNNYYISRTVHRISTIQLRLFSIQNVYIDVNVTKLHITTYLYIITVDFLIFPSLITNQQRSMHKSQYKIF